MTPLRSDITNIRHGTLLRWNALKKFLISEIQDDSVILDLGSYDGFIANYLREFIQNLKILVVDTDRSGLKKAEERGLDSLCASATKLPIDDNSVDVVLCLDLIEHIQEDEKCVREISRVLKNNGKIILTTPMQNGILFPFLSREKNEVINKTWGHVRKGYSLSRISELFLNNGLSVEKNSSYFNLFTRLAYWFLKYSGIPFKGKYLLYRIVTKFEPYIKYGAQEHIVIGKKNK